MPDLIAGINPNVISEVKAASYIFKEANLMKVVNMRQTKEYDVYGGRSGGHLPQHVPIGSDGWLGNPHDVTKPGEKCRCCGGEHERGEAIPLFKKYFWQRVNTDREFLEAVIELNNATVACWCHPQPCHLDVVKAFVDWLLTAKGSEWIKASPLGKEAMR